MYIYLFNATSDPPFFLFHSLFTSPGSVWIKCKWIHKYFHSLIIVVFKSGMREVGQVVLFCFLFFIYYQAWRTTKWQTWPIDYFLYQLWVVSFVFLEHWKAHEEKILNALISHLQNGNSSINLPANNIFIRIIWICEIFRKECKDITLTILFDLSIFFTQWDTEFKTIRKLFNPSHPPLTPPLTQAKKNHHPFLKWMKILFTLQESITALEQE